MKRRYVVTGTQGVVDPGTGEVVAPGGSFSAETGEWTDAQTATGVLTLESDADAPKPAEMRCPICAEQGVKKVPTFADQAEADGHYTDKHPGFVVPTFTDGGEQ